MWMLLVVVHVSKIVDESVSKIMDKLRFILCMVFYVLLFEIAKYHDFIRLSTLLSNVTTEPSLSLVS